MSMYFIGLIPEDKTKQAITKIKKDIADRFDSKHALRLPPHITLQIPFTVEEDDESKLNLDLNKFAKKQVPFRVVLSGFGSFNSKVIYIDVLQSQPIIDLHKRLLKVTDPYIEEKPEGEKKEMNPHITVAYRDLSNENFKKAWPEFRDKSFEDVFVAKSFCLFKHNGKTWDVLKTFQMEGYSKSESI